MASLWTFFAAPWQTNCFHLPQKPILFGAICDESALSLQLKMKIYVDDQHISSVLLQLVLALCSLGALCSADSRADTLWINTGDKHATHTPTPPVQNEIACISDTQISQCLFTSRPFMYPFYTSFLTSVILNIIPPPLLSLNCLSASNQAATSF